MLRSVFRAEIWQRRRSLAWWLGSAFVYLVFIGSVYPTIRGNAAQIDQLLENYPEVFKVMFGVGEGLLYSSPEGFLHLQVFSFVLPLVLLMFTVGFGARTIAGEEEAGTLDLLLSSPVARRTVVLHKAAAMVVSTVAVGVAMTLALLLDGPFFGVGVRFTHLAGAVTSALLLAVFFGAVAILVGSATGKKVVALGATAGLALASYLVFSLAALAPWLEGAQRFSPFFYYAEAQPVRNGLDWGHALVLAGLTVLAVAASVFAFERRDVGT